MRFWLKAPVGLLAMGLYWEAATQTVLTPSSSGAILWALIALAGLFAGSYLWRRWWLAALGALAVDAALWFLTGPAHPVYGVTVLFAALIGWWANARTSWPIAPSRAFLAIAVLVMVSVSLSALLAIRILPVASQTVYALVVLYLATPPWEWLVVILVLRRARHLRQFISDNYRVDRRMLGQIGLGAAAGVGMVAVTSLIVALETNGFHVHIRPNNPFVYAPGLAGPRTGAAVLVAFGVVVLAPLAEEALFRGILFGALSEKWGYWPGSVAAAAIFGLAHLDLSLFIPLALVGVAFNALYRRTGSLWPSTAAHAALNAIAVASALGAAGAWRL